MSPSATVVKQKLKHISATVVAKSKQIKAKFSFWKQRLDTLIGYI